MEEPQVLKLSRLIIFGNDVDKLKSFYADNFNCSVIEEFSGEWIVMNAGGVELALHKIGQSYTPNTNDNPSAESNMKMVFQIDKNLEGFRKQLQEKGIAMNEIKSFDGIDALFCDGRDPEGNVFQIEQKLQ